MIPGQPLIPGVVTRQQQETLAQATADKQLLDRLFPQIIKRIDGNTLLQKIDAKLLAQKVFPNLDLTVVSTERPGQVSVIKANTIYPFENLGTARALASCAADETLVSGGFSTTAGDKETAAFGRDSNTNQWLVIETFDGGGTLRSYAECLKVELALKQ